MQFGMLLKEKRVARGWLQTTLASAIGCTSGFVTKLEKGDALPSYERCAALADALEQSFDDLWALVKQDSAVLSQQRVSAREKVLQRAHVYASKFNKKGEGLLEVAIREGCKSIAEALLEVANALRDLGKK